MKVCRVGLGIHRLWKLYAMSLVMWICQNNLGFSLYTVLSICYIIITSDEWMKSKMEVSADAGVLLLNTGD